MPPRNSAARSRGTTGPAGLLPRVRGGAGIAARGRRPLHVRLWGRAGTLSCWVSEGLIGRSWRRMPPFRWMAIGAAESERSPQAAKFAAAGAVQRRIHFQAALANGRWRACQRTSRQRHSRECWVFLRVIRSKGQAWQHGGMRTVAGLEITAAMHAGDLPAEAVHGHAQAPSADGAGLKENRLRRHPVTSVLPWSGRSLQTRSAL